MNGGFFRSSRTRQSHRALSVECLGGYRFLANPIRLIITLAVGANRNLIGFRRKAGELISRLKALRADCRAAACACRDP
jgi:hypothetical protein